MFVVELIFVAGFTGMLYGAFWLGNKYGSLPKLWAAIKANV